VGVDELAVELDAELAAGVGPLAAEVRCGDNDDDLLDVTSVDELLCGDQCEGRLAGAWCGDGEVVVVVFQEAVEGLLLPFAQLHVA
jgi:hypothetical protein